MMCRAGKQFARDYTTPKPRVGSKRGDLPRYPVHPVGNGQGFPAAFYKINNRLLEGGEKSLATWMVRNTRVLPQPSLRGGSAAATFLVAVTAAANNRFLHFIHKFTS